MKNKSLMVSLEAVGETLSMNDEPVAPNSDDGDEADSQALEEHVQEAEELIQDIDTAQNLYSDVSKYRDILSSGEANKDLNATGAEILTVALEGLYERAGLKESQPRVPSLESFNSRQARSSAIALEELDNKLEQIKQTIIVMLKKMITGASHFMSRIFSADKALDEKTDKLTQLVKSGEATPSEQATEENSSLYGSFCVQGKYQANPIQALRHSVKVAASYVSEYVFPNMSEISPAFNAALSGTYSRQESNSFEAKYLVRLQTRGEQLDKYHLIGNYGFEKEGFDSANLSLTKVELVKNTDAPTEGPITIPNKQLCEQLLAVAKEFSVKQKELENQAKEAITLNEQLSAKLETVKYDDDRYMHLRQLCWQLSFAMRAMQNTNSYVYRQRSAIVKLVEKSLGEQPAPEQQ